MEQFKSWEELSDLEKAQATFWDFYKDVNGFRPRHIDTSSWTLADFDREFQILGQQLEVNNQAEAIAEAEAVAKFEQHVTNTICMGAGDRTTALRWIMEASDANGDWEYFCFCNGLPYRYFQVQETV